LTVTARNGTGADSAGQAIAINADSTVPTTAFTTPAAGTTVQASTTVSVTWTETETGSGVSARSLQRQVGTVVTNGTCTGVSWADDGSADIGASPRSNSGLLSNRCYRWIQTLIDNVGNLSTTTSGEILVNAPPTANDDAWSMYQDNTLVVAASGVLANDSDVDPQTLSVQTPRPVAGPSHGSLALNADGSFTYTPASGYFGSDTFSYRATDGVTDSAVATVTITIQTTAYASSSTWATSFSSSRYVAVTIPAYLPAGSTVTGATLTHTYRAESSGDTVCTYVEVYQGTTLLATHGSAGSPLSCAGSGAWVTDTASLPEIDSAAKANDVVVRVYVRSATGGRSLHQVLTIGVIYHLD
jgi:VCBS repeat-containing protein